MVSKLKGYIYFLGDVTTLNYGYDKNGNMINDSRRALDLSYNVLNLLSEVETTAGALKARYGYLADGTKLQERDDGEVNGFDYTGSLTYRKVAPVCNWRRLISVAGIRLTGYMALDQLQAAVGNRTSCRHCFIMVWKNYNDSVQNRK